MNRKLCINICILFISISFTLVLVELFLRSSTQHAIESYLGRGSNFWEASSGTHRPSKILGYEPIPNSVPYINSYGMFDKEYSLKKEKNIYRIIVLGDSITAHGQYTNLLEDKLNNSNLDYNFEVWNCGVGGYNIKQYMNYLKYKAIKYNPDMIMVGFCLNDFALGEPIVYKNCNIKNGLIEYYSPYSRIKFLMNRFLFRYSYLYRFLMLRLESFLIRKFPYHNINQHKEIGRLCLKAIKKIADNKRCPIIAIIFPYLMPFEEYKASDKDQYKAMIGTLEELGINYVDLHPYFANIDLYQLRLAVNDVVHFSFEGHKLAAEIIYGYLKKKI